MTNLISRQPKYIVGLFFGGILIAGYAIATGMWEGNSNIQLISVGMTGIGLMAMFADDTKTPVSIEEVMNASYSFVRNAQEEGWVPQGSISTTMEARKVRVDGIPVYWEHGVRLENPSEGNPVFKLRVELYKDSKGRISVSGTTELEDWKATEKPDMVIIEPPDMMTFMRLQRIEDDKKMMKHE